MYKKTYINYFFQKDLTQDDTKNILVLNDDSGVG